MPEPPEPPSLNTPWSLALVGEQQLSIAAFGTTRGVPKVIGVSILLHGNGSLNLTLFVVPMICEPLVSQPVEDCVVKYPHLAGLQLADWADGESSLDVDVLVGSDHYWGIVTRCSIQGCKWTHSDLYQVGLGTFWSYNKRINIVAFRKPSDNSY